MKQLQFFILFTVLGFSGSVFSEPWMASRFAQNCSSCHSPGRLNVPATERRCSFSCKSCHTNPNGGGLRNFYGKWNQERWLRSTYVDGYKLNKPQPDGKYERAADGKIGTSDLKEAQARIPQGDPWRQNNEQYFNAGVDLRFFYLDTTLNGAHSKGMMPMATDVAASVKPTEKVNLVWESRFASDPRATSVWDKGYTTKSSVRSAYVLVNDLNYNSFAMYGIYRPLFGHYNPDHTTLFARATGLDHNATFKAASIGTAPGKSFFNLHYIEPFADRTLAQDRGFVLNGGVHFNGAGSYLMFSYWDTKIKDWVANNSTRKKMTSFTGAFTKWGLTSIIDITHIVAVTPSVKSDSGTVITVEPRYRLWKENYLKGGWEYLNTGPGLRLGHAKQVAVGFSSYLMSGLELEVMYKELKATELDVGTREQNYWAQMHFYF